MKNFDQLVLILFNHQISLFQDKNIKNNKKIKNYKKGEFAFLSSHTTYADLKRSD